MLETMENEILKRGVKIILGAYVDYINKQSDKFLLKLNNLEHSKLYDRVIFSIDVRLSEKILLNSSDLIKFTHYIPQHFVYIECENDAIGKFINSQIEISKLQNPHFFIIHHLSPHDPFLYNEDCSFRDKVLEPDWDIFKDYSTVNINIIEKNNLIF